MTKLYISQTYILKRFKTVGYGLFPVLSEEFNSFRYGHFKHIIDVLSMVHDIENVLFEPLAMTGVAFKHKVCHELHLHRYYAGSLAFFASATFRIE